ncbi:hypothetical protein [Actinomadura rifamycini]|uniref:hypothetical protein n=1 Tax=Actinomadura rifamycini TaxID=31962 RepID=UPI0012FA77E3|nr:hypothetical protein [Actinomadura rifamycini]
MDLDYVLAGYRVATRPDRRDWQDPGLPAAALVSLSDCVADLVSVAFDGRDGWFETVREAEAALARADEPGHHVLAVGFAAADVPELLTEISDGGGGAATGGVSEVLARREPFPHDGDLRLGFEPRAGGRPRPRRAAPAAHRIQDRARVPAIRVPDLGAEFGGPVGHADDLGAAVVGARPAGRDRVEQGLGLRVQLTDRA